MFEKSMEKKSLMHGSEEWLSDSDLEMVSGGDGANSSENTQPDGETSNSKNDRNSKPISH